jgi:hypothetical protein
MGSRFYWWLNVSENETFSPEKTPKFSDITIADWDIYDFRDCPIFLGKKGFKNDVPSTNMGNRIACESGGRAIMDPYRRVSEVAFIISGGSWGPGIRLLGLAS